MHVVTHLLMGWALADQARLQGRDRAIVAWASVVPDADGAGVLLDATNHLLGRPETAYYEAYHHALGHSLVAAALYVLIAVCIARRKTWIAVLAFVSFHLHLLCDILGSRGSSPIDIWVIPYLSPFSDALTLSWNGQWPLTGWQNTTITIALLAFVLAQAIQKGYSPVSLFSTRADARFVETLRARFEIR